MTFVDDVEAYLKDNPGDVFEIPTALGCAFVESEVHDEHRWSIEKHTVFQLKTIVNQQPVEFKDEFVLVAHHEPATEEQEDIEDEYPPQVFAVEPYTVEVVKYRPV